MLNMNNLSTLSQLVGTVEGKALLRNAQTDQTTMDYILKLIGVAKPDPTDYAFLKTFSSSINEEKERASRQIRKIMTSTPQTMAIKLGLNALSSVSKMAGNIANTSANRLAEALLAANRTNSDKQTSMYGHSMRENVAEAFAKNKIKKGENWKHVTDALSNFIDKATGEYAQEELTRRTMEATPYLEGVPGNLWALTNGMQSRASKINKNVP